MKFFIRKTSPVVVILFCITGVLHSQQIRFSASGEIITPQNDEADTGQIAPATDSVTQQNDNEAENAGGLVIDSTSDETSSTYTTGNTGIEMQQNNDPQQMAADQIEAVEAPVVYLNRARTLMIQSQYQKAEELLEKAAASAETEAGHEALLLLSQYRARKGNTDILQKARAIDAALQPELLYHIAAGWEAYAIGSRNRDFFEKARELYAETARSFINSEHAHRSGIKEIRMLLQQKQYEGSISRIVTMLEIPVIDSKKRAELWYLLGTVLEFSPEHRDLNAALEAYDKSLELNHSEHALKATRRLNRLYSRF